MIDDYLDKNVWYEFRSYFNRAIIQAIRASSDNGVNTIKVSDDGGANKFAMLEANTVFKEILRYIFFRTIQYSIAYYEL